MKYLTSFILAILPTIMPVLPQEDKEADYREFFNEGEYFFNRGEYQEALYYYLKLMNYQPDNASYNFKIGECYLNIQGKETMAVPYFEKAVKNITDKKEYKKRSFDETRAPLHAYFYLGNAYRINNQLDKALEAYNTFVLSPFYAGNYNATIVENEIKSCERAKIIEDNPVIFTEIPLPDNINTSASELYPVVSGDERKLVFIRRLKFYDALYYSTFEVDGWSDPINITPYIGSDGEFYPTSLSADGNELYLVRRSEQGSDIYLSFYKNDQWSKAIKLGRNINSSGNENAAAISDDGRLLFVSSDRSCSKGGFDLYVSKKDERGNWGKLKNLGKIINTPFDEGSPVSIKNGSVLFFSSKGHFNMGGFDIFYSMLENKKWTTPVNLGSPINNTGDNLFYYPIGNGKTGYISKFGADGGSEDICRLEIRSNLPDF
ncbi:MAG: PD40 domain-containing protein [Bacteroidales bacterium]|nr:PD40 domain-containing protein [Bacteroidales bacterium]